MSKKQSLCSENGEDPVGENSPTAHGHFFNWRGFASLASGFAFLAVVISGVVLYATPRGRVANWTDWTVLGLDKEEWGDLHMVAGILLFLVILLHVFFNFRILLSYFCSRRSRPHPRLRELLVASVLTAVVVAGTIAEWPPFSAVERFNTSIKDHWEKKAADQVTRAPSTWVQEANLPSFAAWAGIPFEDMMETFEEAGFQVKDPLMSINEFASHHGVSSEELFALARSKATRLEEPRKNETGDQKPEGLR